MHYFEVIEHDVTLLNRETAAYAILPKESRSSKRTDFWKTLIKKHRIEMYILHKRIFRGSYSTTSPSF